MCTIPVWFHVTCLHCIHTLSEFVQNRKMGKASWNILKHAAFPDTEQGEGEFSAGKGVKY